MKLPTSGSSSEVAFDLDPLAREIDAQKSSYAVKSMKIELKLAKAVQGVRWGRLEGDEEQDAGSSSTMSAPTLSLLHSCVC